MTLRWRLNLAVLALIAVFLVAAGFTMRAVRQNADQTHLYLRMRELSQFAADVRTHMYQQLARGAGVLRGDEYEDAWPAAALDDIEIQIHQSQDARERALWESVRNRLATIGQVATRPAADPMPLVRATEQDLRSLRDYYENVQTQAIVAASNGSLIVQGAVGAACMLTVLLFLAYLLVVRRWLIQPVQVLKDAAETIGRGRLDHRVPLKGSDELSQLARSIDAMADGLATYQADLVRTRELSALGELCANVAHGLRNPLAAIRSTAQLAERRSQHDNERRLFQDLSAQADRMDQRITTLFQLSRPLDLRRRPVAFMELAQAARAQALPLLKARGLEVTIEDETAGQALYLDAEQIAHAVAELLTNAAHHSEPGHPITLRARCVAAEACCIITVTDRGHGMAISTAQKAFDLFFTSRPEGTGIGLSLVRRVVERHGGTIAIRSELGRGTVVEIQLPKSDSLAPMEDKAARQPAGADETLAIDSGA